MSKMIIYFSLFIPLLFISTDSSSIRDRSNKNELVPFLNSKVDPLKRDSNSLKIVSNEPFIIQLQMPNSREKESKKAFEKDKKRKRLTKKRVSKIKPLRKKHRTRRELLTPKTKIREQKSNQSEMPHAVNPAEQQLRNLTKNSINRIEILKALSSYSKKADTKRTKFEEIKNVQKVKHNAPSRNLHKHDFSLSDQTPLVKMIYPSTPKPDQYQHKYTYKDLMADRERLEQKIKYIKNMLNVNDSAADDTVRVRRRSDSDRTANKIAKMFLTLSAVNGLHDRRKSKCREDDEEEESVRDVWEKERRNNPTRKNSSSNEERYKVKKWIEYLKSKRSSGKTCPCMANEYDEESDVFPLEQKLPKGYFLRGRSSEESSESYSDPFYYSRDKLNNNNLKNRFEKYQDSENNLKALAKNGKKKLELPFEDLEVYRSRAKQILQNAEEILDRIKEEEEKRLHSPNILMSQLKELTSRIQTDPRNNENDLIRKIQKNLGWDALAKSSKETDDNTFIDNVKSFILDPYEKAKALTDESTKKLSSYLLRNLGKLHESSEEQKNGNQETATENSQTYFEQISQKEEKPISASLAKEDSITKVNSQGEDLKNHEDTLFVNLNGDDEVNNKSNQEEVFKQRMEEMIKEQQKKVSEFKVKQDSDESSQEMGSFEERNENVEIAGIKTAGESESKRNLENDELALKLNEREENEGNEEKIEDLINSESTKKTNIEEATKSTADAALTLEKIPENSDFLKKKKKLKTDETSQEKYQTDVTTQKNVSEQEESEEEVKETMKTNYEKVKNDKLYLVDEQEIMNTDDREKDENAKNDDVSFNELEEQKFDRKRENEDEQNQKVESEKAKILLNAKENSSGENTEDLKTINQKNREENVLLSPQNSFYDYDGEDSETSFQANENLKDTAKAVFEEVSDETKSSKETVLRKQETETNEENSTKTTVGENSFTQDNVKELSDQNSKENVGLKEPINKVSIQRQKEVPEGDEKQDSSNTKTTQTDIQYEDPVKESGPEYKDFLESSHSKYTENSLKSDEQSKEQEEETEMSEDQNLTMENPEDEINQAGENDRDMEEADVERQEIFVHSKKLKNKVDENESKSASTEREDRENLNEDDMDISLGVTLDKNSNDNFGESEKSIQESEKSFDGTNEDNQLQAVEFENQEVKTTEKSINDETSLKEPLENRNQYENEKDNILEAKKSTEEMSNESSDKNKKDVNAETLLKKENKNNDERKNSEIPLKTTLNTQSDENDSDTENNHENILRETISKENNDKEISKKLAYSNEEGSSETFLKSPMKEDGDLEGSSKTSQNVNETSDGETKNTVKEVGDKTFPEDFHEDGGNPNSKTLVRLIGYFESQEENEKGDSNETTLRVGINKKKGGNFNEMGDKTISVIDSKDEAEGMNENDEKKATLSLEKPQPQDSFENQSKPLSSQKQDLLKKKQSEEMTSKEAMLDKTNQENQSSENFEEKDGKKTLKASLNKESQESNEESDQDRKSSSHETFLKSAQKNLNESPDDETLKITKLNEELEENQKNTEGEETYLKSTFKYTDQKSTEGEDDDKIIKVSSQESEQKQDNFNNAGSTVGKVLDKQEQATEMNDDKIERKLNENENSEEADGEDTPSKITNPGEDKNDNRNSFENDREEIPLEPVLESRRQEKKDMDNDETTGTENFEEDHKKEVLSNKDNETPLKTTNSENELDNKIENDETLLKSEKDLEKKDGAELDDQDESEETLREENILGDLSNQVDQENEDDNSLRSKHFNEINERKSEKSSHEESYETLTAEKPSTENLSAEDEPQLKAAALTNHDHSPDSQEEQNHSAVSDLIQKTDSSKTDKLKVPKSIGKIMKALEGKEKDDITSFRNLNPDKIDHIIDKIDEAEQQNLRQSQEVDCRKECACAEEIDTKSRNIGRYEIVKDFLFWMKDLQLNRVLSDD